MLAEHTLISMNDGTYCPIHLVKLNQTVKSYENGFKIGLVKSIAAYVTSSVIKLLLSNGDSIICSAGLKFYVKKHGWVEADFLQHGMEFLSDDGSKISLYGVSFIEQDDIELYNLLSIDPFKTFFCNKVLVHNGHFFTRGTRITTTESDDLIESSHIHENVLSHTEDVSKIHVNKISKDTVIYVIKFINHNALIGVGASQYFYVNNKSSWVRADEISIGDSIRLRGDDEILVKDVELIYDNTDDLFYVSQDNPQSTFFANGFLTTSNKTIKL